MTTFHVKPISAAELERRSQIEALWASRLVYEPAINAERRARFEINKVAMLERDLPASVVRPQEAPAPAVFSRVAGGRG